MSQHQGRVETPFEHAYFGILGLYGDNGKENGNYYLGFRVILGLYKDNGKENGNYYSMIG